MKQVPVFATWWERLHHALLALVQLLFAVLLVSLRRSTTQGALYRASTNGAATVAFVVQVIAAVLGLGNLYVLRSLAGHYARRRLTKSPMNFDVFAFWTYLASGSFDFSLSPWFLFITLVVSILSFGPAALWAGAITPTPATQDCRLAAQGEKFSPASKNIWDAQFEFREGPAEVWNHFDVCIADTINGALHTNCPVPTLNDNLLRAAVAAVSMKPNSSIATDSSGYSSIGRSYGVGHGVGITPGLTQPELESKLTSTFSFHEPGYETTVTCIKNTSSALGFHHHVPGDDVSIPNIWALAGNLPNTISASSEFYPITTWRSPNFENLTAWAAVHNPYTTTSFLSIAAGPQKYSLFNQTQCQFTFTPRLFLITANTTSRTIHRLPLPNHPPPQSLPQSLPASVIRTLNLLSRMKSSLYVSELGETLHSALKSYAAFNAIPTDDHASAVLPMASLFFTSMADQILGAYANAQIFIAKDTQPLEIVSSSCKAVKLGSSFYTFIVLGFNLAVVLLVGVGLVLTKLWRDLPSWDSRSVWDLVTASMAARGGGGDEGDMCWVKLVPPNHGRGWCLETSAVT
ncbi:hypothetical protein QBC34DRAFT_404443 [Podospora aff. communis PSN243]|uniref:Uncharacterized protein n=1 Tax=Podospora aff. communis PSN243 TaxID=3040156 RepID=A0AAV9GN03_9PEZI|nr:hypothetical protein QBC34DRAFT_404443 [Podospora aff. communis PSN243]